MSDLVGGVPLSARAQNGSNRPAPGSGSAQSRHPGVRTPTDIMRRREEREQRRRELEEQERREADRRRQEAEEAPEVAATSSSAQPPIADDPRLRRETAVPGDGRAPAQRIPFTDIQPTQNVSTNQPHQPRPTATGSQPPRIAPTAPAAVQQPPQEPQRTNRPNPNIPQTSTDAPIQQTHTTTSQQAQDQPRKSTFPHAFERWETLSSHWEGLTGYWIRKLEANKDELSTNSLNQQMARQINDLSAAGANLFHAVVELQRLRASSERKFQRWFFDTRKEQEKAREIQADLERQLMALRQEQGDSMTLRQTAENERRKSEELVKEMRRELHISKEEARRAWEELGRREQEERERTNSLRNGEPTLVGGVQVVPMVQGIPSRQTSVNRPPTREGPYPGGPGPTHLGGQLPQNPSQPPRTEEYYEEQRSSPTETDPFIDNRRAHRQEPESQASQSSAERQPPISNGMAPTSHAVAPQGYPTSSTAAYPREQTGRFYQHEGSAIHRESYASEGDDRSYVPSTEGSDIGGDEYVANPDGSYHLDPQGRRIPFSRTPAGESEEYSDRIARQGGYQGSYTTTGVETANLPASTGGSAPGYGPGLVDYSGSDWGSVPGWESVPRHRHPTRLSDVLEEDERSRTSPSRTSQVSRTMH